MSTQLRKLIAVLSMASFVWSTPLMNKTEFKPSRTSVSTTSGLRLSGNSTAAPTAMSNSVTTNKERNWLLTKAWLIDNINRLRHEFNELERDYSHHIEAAKTMNTEHDKKLVQDMSTLRADHIVLSQQQKQIIELIKKSQYNSVQPDLKRRWTRPSASANSVVDPSVNSSMNSVLIKKRHKKRDSHLKNMVQTFEDQTKRNMSEVFAEMSALHDITISIFEDLMDLQKKINQKSWSERLSADWVTQSIESSH